MLYGVLETLFRILRDGDGLGFVEFGVRSYGMVMAHACRRAVSYPRIQGLRVGFGGYSTL